MTKFYKPKFAEEETKLNISSKHRTANQRLNSIAENGVIEVELDAKVVKQRIAKDLYSSWQSGFRELFNNEARACRIAINTHNAKARLIVSIDSSKKELIIGGYDSMGITSEVFDKSLRTMGVSGNLDSSEIGQFGFGFASYTTMTDLIKFETWSRDVNEEGDHERYSLMGKQGVDFQILKDENSLETYGTRLTLTYNDQVNESELFNLVKKLSRFSHVPVTLINKHDLDDTYGSDSDYDNAGSYEMPVWKTYKEYIEALIKEDHDDYGVLLRRKWNIVLDIKNEDWEFYGSLICEESRYDKKGKWSTRINDRGSGETVLVGTPIRDGCNFNQFTDCILNIKNERKYPPTADRDRMTKGSIDDIQKSVDKSIKEKVSTLLDIHSLADYRKSEYKDLINHYRFDDILNDDIKDIKAYLGIRVHAENRTSSWTSVSDCIDKNPDVIFYWATKFESIRKSAIERTVKNALFIKCASSDIQLLESNGAVNCIEYMQEQKIKLNRPNTRVSGEVAFWKAIMSTKGSGYYASKYLTKGNIKVPIADLKKQYTIRCKGKIREQIINTINDFECDYGVVADLKMIYDYSKTLDELYKEKKDCLINTTEGVKKWSEILKTSKIWHTGVFEHPEIIEYYNKSKSALVVKDYNELFELKVLALFKDKESRFMFSKESAWQRDTKMMKKEEVNIDHDYSEAYPQKDEFQQVWDYNHLKDIDMKKLYNCLTGDGKKDKDVMKSFMEVHDRCVKN